MTDNALLLQAFQILPDRRQPAGQCLFRYVDKRGIPAMLRKHVGDAIAHRPGADHGHFAHPASQVRGCFQRAPITASVPAISTIVATMPPSGPNGPPSTHAWRPGEYSTAGTWKALPLTGASNRIDRPAFQPKCRPHASAMPPFEKNANESHTAASA